MELSALDITPSKEKQFNKKGIFSAEDLVRFLPRRYHDFTKETGILPEAELSCFTATVNRVKTYNSKTPMMIAFCTTASGKPLLVKWFRQNFLRNKISALIGNRAYIVGHVSYNAEYKSFSITGPELFEPNIADSRKIVPVYSKIQGMSGDYLQSRMKDALSITSLIEESCPYNVIKKIGKMGLKEAICELHFPSSIEKIKLAQDRMLFDDLLYFALRNEQTIRNACPGSQYSVKTTRILNKIAAQLPYRLTKDQISATNEMVAHIKEGKRVNALVQGDVGCGKTIIAFLMMALMADNGYQTVLMAPTQVLARQHYEDLTNLIEPFGFKTVFLGANIKAAEKKKILKDIASGEAKFIVGTHAVLGKNVEYHNLALTVADEEHKFGVAQRAALTKKATEGVHSLTMSATPIPRTLAQIVYGDAIQLLTIVTKPNGRLPVKTGIAKGKERIYRFLEKEIANGRQAYVVCPLIEQSDALDGVKSVEEISAEYHNRLDKSGIKIETLTGRNTREETEDIIGRFKSGETKILIATTVIEVGVNVPNATTIVITNAERFGLSSLHQLRGRVGRGSYQSYCVLDSETQTDDGLQRLNAMVKSNNGFEIAMEDLRIRGTGDVLGTKQSGSEKYMTLAQANPETYALAKRISSWMIDNGIECAMTIKAAEDAEQAEFCCEVPKGRARKEKKTA